MSAQSTQSPDLTTEKNKAEIPHTAGSGRVLPGLVAGLSATLVFYLTGPWIAACFSGGEVFFQRYFCGHPLEYVTSTIFFIGMAILGMKFRRLPAERRALRQVRLSAADRNWPAQRPTNARQAAAILLRELEEHTPRKMTRSAVAQRLADVLQQVSLRPDAALDDHLRYLADLAVDRLHQSYQLVRTVTWAVPIMGFLGTVIGITMAIANVTPEQLDSSLPEVTSGLAVAFDTTAQALGMSMVLVFATFLVERSEQSVLSDTEQFGIDVLLPLLESPAADVAPATAASAALTELLRSQAEFWNSRFASLQADWQQTLTRQTSAMAQALSADTAAMLQTHRETLGQSRDAYAAALQSSAEQLGKQLHGAFAGLAQRMDVWQSALQSTTASAAGQTEELHRLGRTLLQLTESEERLARLQEQLNQNLQALQVVDTLEQTVNSLNAAVAVLSARTHLRSAA
ncbi:MAG: MotA/TolQ/ExbB proton channel family protein [Planctomycetota bacterium]